MGRHLCPYTKTLLGAQGLPSPWPRIGEALPIPGDTSSSISFLQAKKWISDCLANHPECQNFKMSQLPKRTVELLGSGPVPRIRLHESQNDMTDYLCLSHCWGHHQPITTTTHSLEEYKKEIPWRRLPKTFQDAILFTMRLGFRHLWIDSLCILQDSRKDWLEESAKMCEIYQGAFLTLFATNAQDGSEGLFSLAKKKVNPLVMNGTDPISGKQYSIHARPLESHFYSPDNQEERQKHHPLLSRGWVYQERLMSRRIIHFGSNEISWECSESIKCECSGSVYGVQSTNAPKLWHRIDSQAEMSEIEGHWQKMVTKYTQLALTYSSDRLSALAGLAMEMQPRRSGRYLAGLWEDTILSDLCWYSASPTSNRSKCNVPSWSWASVDSKVTYPSFTGERVELTKFLNISWESEHLNTTGDPLPSRIWLRGRIASMKYPDGESINTRPNLEPVFLGPRTVLGSRTSYFLPDVDMSSNKEWNRTFYTLEMMVVYSSMGIRILYLVLFPVDELGLLYERVGFCWIWLKSQSETGLIHQGTKKIVGIC